MINVHINVIEGSNEPKEEKLATQGTTETVMIEESNKITIDETGYVIIPDSYPIEALALISVSCSNGKFAELIYQLSINRLKDHPEELEQFKNIMTKFGDNKNEEFKSKPMPVMNAINSWNFGGLT